jgi:hypothetical protein
MLIAIIALGCAALIGFAAHRASLCNVRAVAELMTSGSAHMLWSLLQAMLWTIMLTGVLALVFGLAPQPAWTRTRRAVKLFVDVGRDCTGTWHPARDAHADAHLHLLARRLRRSGQRGKRTLRPGRLTP